MGFCMAYEQEWVFEWLNGFFKWLKKFLKNNASDLSKLKEIQITIYSERKWSHSVVSDSLQTHGL